MINSDQALRRKGGRGLHNLPQQAWRIPVVHFHHRVVIIVKMFVSVETLVPTSVDDSDVTPVSVMRTHITQYSGEHRRLRGTSPVDETRNEMHRAALPGRLTPQWLLSAVLLAQGVSAMPLEQEPSNRSLNHAQELKPFNSLIGEWRGVGQLKRGSRKGAWTEQTLCEWQFTDTEASVVLKSSDNRQFEYLRLTWDRKRQQLVLIRKTKEGVYEYRGQAPNDWPGAIRLVTTRNDDGVVYRCTMQQLSDIRTTVLFEKQTSPTGNFRRDFGIGYTRAGTKLARSGTGRHKCVVTGGLGTIPVSFQGKTYYVCCRGCVQAFNDAPAAVIEQYRASLRKP